VGTGLKKIGVRLLTSHLFQRRQLKRTSIGFGLLIIRVELQIASNFLRNIAKLIWTIPVRVPSIL